jgi:glycosyltransferase involved in cell wall biosynthesis
MRLAVIETTPYGGLLHYAVQLADSLAERGHDVELIVPRENELVEHRGAARMRAVLKPTVDWTKQAHRHPVRYFLRRGRIATRLLRSWLRILWEVRRGRYEVVVVNCDVGLAPAAAGELLLTRLPGPQRIVQVAHNARNFNRWGGSDMFSSTRVLDALFRRLPAGLDLVLVHGEQTKQELLKGWPDTSVAVIPFGADWPMFSQEPPPPADEERILFFGDWRKIKGLPLLMKAFDELARRRPQARLTIAGRPAPHDVDPDTVHEWARRHGERVTVIDNYVPIEQVREVFGSARVVVLPYIVGYQSGVLHLAMAHGRAVVATDIGDFGNVIQQGETGVMVPPGDVGSLVDALEQAIADPEQAARWGAAGHRRTLDLSAWSMVAERVEQALVSSDGAVVH